MVSKAQLHRDKQAVRHEREEKKRKKRLIEKGQTKKAATIKVDEGKGKAKKPLAEPVKLGFDKTPTGEKDEQGRIVLNQPEEKDEARKTAEGVLKTTLAVGTGVAVGAAAFLGGAAFLGNAAKSIKVSSATMGSIRTSLQNKAIVGKLVEMGKGARGVTAARFGTNVKSVALTKSLISKIGGASALIAIIGSYPFAGFIKEESLQTLSFGVLSAKNSGNLEGEQEAIDEVNKILDPAAWEKLIAAVPFANVVKQLVSFYKAAATKNALDQESLDKRREAAQLEEDTGETPFQAERRLSDEQARERELGYREEDEKYFEDKREEAKQRTEEERSESEDYYKKAGEERKATEELEKQTESEYYENIATEKKAGEDRERQIMQEVWRLRREGKYSEADELELTI